MIDAFSSEWLGQRARCIASLARQHYAKSLLLASFVAISGCTTSRNEGRATAILDVALPEAKAHAVSLTGDDMTEARRTGVRLLAVLGQWE